MTDINPGDVITVTTTPPFTDQNGAPTDPTEVTLTWYLRGEPPTTWTWPGDAEITSDGDGVFSADIPISRPGKYYARWAGTGDVQAAEEITFEATTSFGG